MDGKEVQVSVYHPQDPETFERSVANDNCYAVLDGHACPEGTSEIKRLLMSNLRKVIDHKQNWNRGHEAALNGLRLALIQFNHELERDMGQGVGALGISVSVLYFRASHSIAYVAHVGNGESKIALGLQDPTSILWKGEFLTEDRNEQDVEGGAQSFQTYEGHGTRALASMGRSVFKVIEIDNHRHRCLILGAAGIWNALSVTQAVTIAYSADCNTRRRCAALKTRSATRMEPELPMWNNIVVNPSTRLSRRAQSHLNRARDSQQRENIGINGPPVVANASNTVNGSMVEANRASAENGNPTLEFAAEALAITIIIDPPPVPAMLM